MNPSTADYFQVEMGTAFTDTFDPASETWTPMSAGRVVIPETVQFNAGSEPGKLVFHVYADSAYDSSGVYPAIGSKVDPAGKRPDGGVGGLSLPSYEDAPLKPFTTIKLTELADPLAATGETRFVGVVLACKLNLSNDTWVVTALEVARWRFSMWVVACSLWHDTNKDDEDNPVVFLHDPPVFNVDGKRDMWLDAEGNRQLRFYHPDFKYVATGYIVKHWRLGDILNYLRLLYYVLDPDTGKTILGIDGCSTYVLWDEVTPETHPWLFELDGKEQVFPDFALGTMTLLEAIDTIIRKSGEGSEWSAQLGVERWELKFYNADGLGDVTLTRGGLGDEARDYPPDLSGGEIGYDWTRSATSVTVFGKQNIHEMTIAYDPNNVMEGYFQDLIKPDWDNEALLNYMSAEIAGNPDANTDFPSVFTKFRFREDKNWAAVFGGTFTNTRQGQRSAMANMVSKVKDGSGEIQAKVWRWEQTVAGVPVFFGQPESVSMVFNQDESFTVHGIYKRDAVLPGTENDATTKWPRFLCKVETAPTLWSVRPFAITFTVIGDERAYGEDSGPSPDGWPEGLEDTPDISKFGNQWRYKAMHFLDGAGKPIQDNPTSGGLVSPVAEKVLNQQDYLDAAATRRKTYVERPSCEGSLALGGNFDWTIVPGSKILLITGGGTPTLPDLYLGALVRSVTYGGIGTRNLMTMEQRLELGNG